MKQWSHFNYYNVCSTIFTMCIFLFNRMFLCHIDGERMLNETLTIVIISLCTNEWHLFQLS